MKKSIIVVLTLTLSCLFSIIGVRVTVNSVVTPAQCIIHKLPSSPVLINASDGTIGGLILYPEKWTEDHAPNYDVMIPTVLYSFECKYPDFSLSSNTFTQYTSILIPSELVSVYDHKLAAQYICSDCMHQIELRNPTSNFLFLSFYEGTPLHVWSLDDARQGFALCNYYFSQYTHSLSSIEIRMEYKS